MDGVVISKKPGSQEADVAVIQDANDIEITVGEFDRDLDGLFQLAENVGEAINAIDSWMARNHIEEPSDVMEHGKEYLFTIGQLVGLIRAAQCHKG